MKIMTKLNIILAISLIVLFSVMGLASATIESLPSSVQINTCVNLIQVDNVSSEFITTVVKPNEIVNVYSTMDKNGTFFNYTFCNNDVYGRYTVNGNDNMGNPWAYYYLVGNELSVGKSLIYLLFLSILFILLCLSVYGINKADKGEWQIFYICTSYVLTFSLVFIFWLFSQNYLYDIPLLESTFWILWITLAGLFFPFIIIVSAYILKKQGEALMVDDYQKQGYTKEESLEMAKSRKR